MSDLLHRRPRLLALTLILIAVAGLAGLQVLPRAEDPKLTDRFAQVFTSFVGADAARVEALVTEPLEDELREVEEIKEIAATSLSGSSTLSLELRDDVTAVDEVWSRVRDRLADAARALPSGAGSPEFEETTSQAFTVIVALTWELEGDVNLTLVGRLAEELADTLRSVPGTERAQVFGEPEEEVLVEADPAQLAAYGLRVEDLARALQGGDAKVAAGRVHGERNELLFEVAGEIDTLARVASLPVSVGATDGVVVRLGDVARVTKAAVDPPRTRALISGAPGVAVAARMQTGQRVDLWTEDARAALGDFAANLPRGVGLQTLFEQSRYTDERLTGLVGNLGLGALFVAVVILVTMGWRSALLVGSALPLTSLMVLAGMRLLGVPIHQMSVTGLIIALGLMIDNAIVMVDEIRHRREDGREIGQAIREAVRRLTVPLLGSTVTTVLAFMPIVLMPGPAGEFVGSIALSVILALVSSLLLALTVLPALSGLIGRSDGAGGWWRAGVAPRWLARGYRSALEYALARPAVSLLIALALPVLGFAGFSRLDEQFFPAADRDQFQVELRLPWQTPVGGTERQAVAAREVLLQHPAVADVHWFVGESAPRFYYNILDGRRGTSFYAQALVQLHEPDGSIEVVADVQRMLDEAFPLGQMLARPIEQGPPVDAPVEVRLFGSDLRTLRELGLRIRAELARLPTITHTRATLDGGQPILRHRLDEDAARLIGLSNVEIAGQLQASTDGIVGGSLIEGTEELPVRVRLGAARSDLDRLAALDLPVGGGKWTPLSALGDFELSPEAASIPRRDGQRCNTVQGFVVAGSLPSVALGELQTALAASGFEPPPGYTLRWGGEAAERDEAVSNLMAVVSVLLVLMAAALVLSFDSFRMAAVIGGVGVLSVGLSLLALRLFDMPFGFMAIVGTMGLVGVAVSDSIVVLAALRRNERARAGDRAAVVDEVTRASRHLVSTSLTTMAGFTPLLIAGGGFWPPLAVAIAGGVAGATVLAMTFVPTMFLWGHRRRRERSPGRESLALDCGALSALLAPD